MIAVDILGKNYEVEFCDKNDPDLESNDGVCRNYSNKIKIRKPEYMLDDGEVHEAKESRLHEVIRHELVHAFSYQSGCSFDDDEALVDWIARMIPKIEAVYAQIIMESGK